MLLEGTIFDSANEKNLLMCAENKMKASGNCCETLSSVVNDHFALALSDETINATMYFKNGAGCGTICGALAGAVMVSGILAGKINKPSLGKEVMAKIMARFTDEYKSINCKDIRSGRSLLQKLRMHSCVSLTAHTTLICVQEWERVLREAGND